VIFCSHWDEIVMHSESDMNISKSIAPTSKRINGILLLPRFRFDDSTFYLSSARPASAA
jgi:hypothetical protein